MFSNEEKGKIINMYVNEKKSIIQISDIFGCHFSTISNYLRKWGISLRTPKENKKFSQNSDVFDVIDSEEKAYWLGFMFADGFITKGNYVGISLSSIDRNHLEKFKKFCSATNEIKDYIGTTYNPTSAYSKIIFKNDKMANDLEKHGCLKNKSLILDKPIGIPVNFEKDFLRGYFDGDGSLCIGKYVSFKVCGTKEFLKYFCQILQKNISEENFELKLYKRKKDDKNNYYISFGGIRKTTKIMDFLYNDTKIFLDRKMKTLKTLHSRAYQK